ncbi:aminotransferase-like domain-containing protein [Rhizobium sp. SL86]|uniref:aminotransferase-like domain-containing protein n=1 Tax=Rhizobium sp. SL86 TaxID=2995148 RepID=UPI0022723EE3|nr:PLP-dependent aminotransferase family protein [Rhizobium sp. SL86]MCY1668175.1 PLP-dependent aminotransferase family protein [Rhizobium sp. SL86]
MDMGTRRHAVMDAIRTRIEARTLLPGDRLPSVRGFAATMKVSPATVVDAYERLVAEGLIRAQRGSGFYVADGLLQPLTLMQSSTPQARAVDPFWVSRQSLDAGDEVLRPGCGWLPADWMPQEALSRAMRQVARSSPALLADYGSTRGSPALRRLLLSRFAEEGLVAQADQLMLTSTGTQALDLNCRFLLRPGDTVLIDDPCYFNFQALLKAHQVKVVSVPYTVAGPDLDAFETVLETERPRLYLTNSALHNPTGATLSAQVAHRLLTLATRHGVSIVEDDIFADFEPETSVRLAALDGLASVIRIGSFSKTLSASIRCGYIAARADWIDGLVDLQVATNFGGPSPIAADIIAQVLSGGGYRKHLDILRRRLSHARRDVEKRLAELGIEPVLRPRGGFYLWCRLPDATDAAMIAQRALSQGVVLAPGNVFSLTQTASNLMRFNVAQMQDRRIDMVLAQALRESA